MYVGMQAGRVL